jgi:hypothetical protein
VINQYIEQQQAQQQVQQKAAQAKAKEAAQGSQDASAKEGEHSYPDHAATEKRDAAEPAPKKIVTFETSSVLRSINPTGMLETEQDIEDYLSALRQQLSSLVAENNKVRIK